MASNSVTNRSYHIPFSCLRLIKLPATITFTISEFKINDNCFLPLSPIKMICPIFDPDVYHAGTVKNGKTSLADGSRSLSSFITIDRPPYHFCRKKADDKLFSLQSSCLSMPILREEARAEKAVFLHTDWHRIAAHPADQKDEHEAFNTFFNPDGRLKTRFTTKHKENSHPPYRKIANFFRRKNRVRIIRPCLKNVILSKINIITLEAAQWPAYSSRYEKLKADIWYDPEKPSGTFCLEALSPDIDTLEGHKNFEISIEYAIEFVFSDKKACHVTTDFDTICGALCLALCPFPCDFDQFENMLIKRRKLSIP